MSYNDLFQNALIFYDKALYNEAEANLRQILETAPDHPDVLNLLGLIAQAKGLHKEACSYFSAALRQKDNQAAFYYNLAFLQKKIGCYNEALFNFSKVLQLAPQTKETYNEIACIYETLSDLENARKYWSYALSLDADYAEALINQANSFRTEDRKKAIESLETLTDRFADNPLLWYDLAWLNYKQKEYDKALIQAQKAFDAAPDNDAVCVLTGNIYFAQKKVEKAEFYWRKAEAICDDNFEAKLRLADLMSQNGNFEQAESRYLRLKELGPKNFDVYNNYGEMLFRQGRLVEALEEYRQAVILNPDAAEVSNNLGVILKDLKDYLQAIDLFFNALKLAPAMEEISINLAESIILLSQTNEKEAVRCAEKWEKEYPDNPFAQGLNAALKGDIIENNQVVTEKLFDHFADHYELVMQNLDYSAPMAVRRIAGSVEGRIADIGCGSGLVGVALKKDNISLIGVDVSVEMLNQARQKNIYDELIKSDALEFLRHRSDFDWIVAADVLEYIPHIEDFICLAKGKNIIFTIEKSDDDIPYSMRKNGRIQHNPNYVENLLQANGFSDILREDLVLRTENGVAVNGCIFKALGR
ncbi:MAG: tetratricopeptide repeat protein [Alphaproteobacteria bacterium]|nr:tetratricopeptide repeat protein [Alphaproteobacteria bacterium]